MKLVVVDNFKSGPVIYPKAHVLTAEEAQTLEPYLGELLQNKLLKKIEEVVEPVVVAPAPAVEPVSEPKPKKKK